MSTQGRTAESQDTGFARSVAAASGADPLVCLQCRKCTCGCPVAARVDLRPHELVRLVQLGERDEVLKSRMLWECTSCQTCVTRCPQSVNIPALVDALRQLSRAERKTAATTAVPVFNDVFLGTVCRLGRMYEAGLMASFKLRTGRFFEDLDKLPMMLRKGKLALVPPLVRGGAERKRLFRRAKAAGGKRR
jgi:heterodisulfide reductase subunit C